MEIKAYAKINLLLDIIGRRADGYHTLDTVFQPVSFFDTLTGEEIPAGLEFSCSDRSLENADNLAVRAFRQLQAHCGIDRGLRLHLEKRLPSQAGMGGGSSDAAAVLRLCSALFGLELSREELIREGAALGADVPCFLIDGPSRGRGTGTEVTPIRSRLKLPLLVIKPPIACSTPLMYRRLDEMGLQGDRHRGDRVQEALERGSAEALLPWLHNDFEAAAGEEIACLLALLRQQRGALTAQLSGSGSAVWAAFAAPADRDLALERLKKRLPEDHLLVACETLP